ncbi:MAG: hypothetical protein IM638_06340 [Bacteroidetes bacterium]|nr:hypothetical protein [Bacteroidota bacterium]
MKFLFYDKLTLETRLSKNEVYYKLQHYVLKRDNFFWGFVTKQQQHLYEGRYTDQHFLIRRIINYRNSFLPVIDGEYDVAGNRTRIKIKMRLYKFIYFIFIPLMIIIPLGIIFNINAVPENKFSPEMLLPLLMPFVFYSIIVGFFIYEATRAKKELIRLFEAEEITTGN